MMNKKKKKNEGGRREFFDPDQRKLSGRERVRQRKYERERERENKTEWECISVWMGERDCDSNFVAGFKTSPRRATIPREGKFIDSGQDDHVATWLWGIFNLEGEHVETTSVKTTMMMMMVEMKTRWKCSKKKQTRENTAIRSTWPPFGIWLGTRQGSSSPSSRRTPRSVRGDETRPLIF